MSTGNIRKKPEHVYKYQEIEYTRAAALYGANGAGKSNLVKAIDCLQGIVSGKTPESQLFKLNPDKAQEPSVFEIEFVQNDILYYYEVAFVGAIITKEALYEVDLQREDDHLLFERTIENGKISLKMATEYQQNPKEQYLVELYTEKLLKKEESFLWRTKQDNLGFDKLIEAWTWITKRITIIYPSTVVHVAAVLAGRAGQKIAENIQQALCTLDTGISAVTLKESLLEDYLGEDESEKAKFIREEIFAEEAVGAIRTIQHIDTYFYKAEDEEIYVKQLRFKHQQKNKAVDFLLAEESDGTQRALDLLYAIQVASSKNAVVFVDEIDRSIHPSLTKAIVQSFMDRMETNGQLIFTTHEANLLDLNIFRQDEIWFVEKNKAGETTLYPLSDFKVRSDLSVKKGYLNGRFGAIPFLGDFEKLGWEEEVSNG